MCERERDHLKKQIFKGVKSLKKKGGGGCEWKENKWY